MTTRTESPRERTARRSEQRFVRLALDLGALGARVVSPSAVQTAHWVRWKCQFGCSCYASSRMCPPHTPKPSQTRAMLDGYRRAVLFEAPPGQATRIAADLERRLFLEGFYKALGLGAGPCTLCDECHFEAGCPHPDEARPAMEACGIDVFATVRKHGFVIDVVRSARDRQHYFGLVLID